MIHGLNLCQLVKILLEKSCSLCPHRRKESQPQLASNRYNQYVYSKSPWKVNKKCSRAQVLSSSASVWMTNCYTEAGCVKGTDSPAFRTPTVVVIFKSSKTISCTFGATYPITFFSTAAYCYSTATYLSCATWTTFNCAVPALRYTAWFLIVYLFHI